MDEILRSSTNISNICRLSNLSCIAYVIDIRVDTNINNPLAYKNKYCIVYVSNLSEFFY